MRNLEKLQYTYRHRQAFRYVLDSFFADSPCYQELLQRSFYHDLDKSLYLTLGDKSAASAYHRAHQSHHMENGLPKSKIDLYEAVIDYECAGYTKADKPLNAYDTIIRYDKPRGDEMLEILREHGMDSSYDNTPENEDWVSYLSQLPLVTEENILSEIYEYTLAFPDEASAILDEISSSRT